jgi:hypothetical protein
MYVGRCELQLPTSGTRDPNLRDHLFSFARCPRVETALAAAVLPFDLNLDQSISGCPSCLPLSLRQGVA